MAKKTVENQQPMSEAREAINDNFTELYNQLGGSSSGGGGSPTTNAKLKEYIDSFSRLGFDPPDAIIVMDQYLRMSVRHLQLIGSDIDYDGNTPPAWNFVYRTFLTGSSDYNTRFKNEPDGPQQTVGSGMQHADFVGKDLKWFVDNGYAIYTGGGTSSGGTGRPFALQSTDELINYATTDSSWAGNSTATILDLTGGPFKVLGGYAHSAYLQGPKITVDGVLMYDFGDPGTNMLGRDQQAHGGAATSIIHIPPIYAADSVKIEVKNSQTNSDEVLTSQIQYVEGGHTASSGETWGVFDGTESGVGPGDMLTIQAGNNIQTIEYISTGVYEVTVINPMPSEFYHVSVGVNPSGFSGADGGVADDGPTGNLSPENKPTASKFRIDIRNNANVQLNSDRITFHVVC